MIDTFSACAENHVGLLALESGLGILRVWGAVGCTRVQVYKPFWGSKKVIQLLNVYYGTPTTDLTKTNLGLSNILKTKDSFKRKSPPPKKSCSTTQVSKENTYQSGWPLKAFETAIASEVGICGFHSWGELGDQKTSIGLQDCHWTPKRSKEYIFVDIVSSFFGGQVLIRTVYRCLWCVFLQFNGCPGHLFFIEQRYWSMHIVPCWNILLQVSGHRPQQEPKRPSCSEDFKISPQNSQSDDYPITLSKWTYLTEVLSWSMQFKKYYLSPLWSSRVSRLQRILHSSSTCNSRGKCHPVDIRTTTTAQKPVIHSSWKGKLQREVVKPRCFSESLNKITSTTFHWKHTFMLGDSYNYITTNTYQYVSI